MGKRVSEVRRVTIGMRPSAAARGCALGCWRVSFRSPWNVLESALPRQSGWAIVSIVASCGANCHCLVPSSGMHIIDAFMTHLGPNGAVPPPS